MARIVRTTEKNRKGFLLKAGLSIFLFLQIQLPNAAEVSFSDQENLSAVSHMKHDKKCCFKVEKESKPIAFVAFSAK